VQFAAGEESSYPHVESRMLLAVEAGRGVVEVDGQVVDLAPGSLVVMPWGHSVRYRPDTRDPYLVYGAHLIPWHSAAEPIDLAVPHHREHPLTGVPTRGDRPLAIGPRLWTSAGEQHPSLRTVARLAAQVWDRGTPTLEVARALGTLVVDALEAATPVPAHDDHGLPVALRRALAWIHAEPGRTVTLEQLSAAAGVSPATVTRQFRQHLRTSPLAWVLDSRIAAAKVLLTTTGLPVAQVGRRVGFDDSYYFSRQFRARTGLTPSVWRQRHSAP
jgi:AraC family transcriptional regulator, arabinose operon regulatory protein